MPELAQQVVVQEYQSGQGIGRHIDLQPQTVPELRDGFGPVVVSLSILSSCVISPTLPRVAGLTSRWRREAPSP
jgi:alkylated DNA repair dioxygenase AlkB